MQQDGAIATATEVHRLHAALLSALRCVVPNRSAIYLSGPITTGLAFAEWYRSEGMTLERCGTQYDARKAEVVIRPNEEAILAAAQRVRQRERACVIEPASLRVPLWTQRDYHSFWMSVLQEFVGRVVVIRGWDYSVGCAIEIAHAIEADIPINDLNGARLQSEEVKVALRRAAEVVAQDMPPTSQLALLSERLLECSLRI